MTLRRVALVLVLVAAGCKSAAGRPGVRLAKPSGVAFFQGYTQKTPGSVRPYVAIASSRGDELRLIDAVDDTVVMSPSGITALSVPVDPRPALLASGSLHDPDTSGATPVERPWLLASASTGMVTVPQAGTNASVVTSQIQVVATWNPATVVDRSQTISLADYAAVADAVVLSMAVAARPMDDGTGTWVPTPGEARLLVGLSGGRLMVFDFVRDGADQTSIVAGPATPVIQDLGFEPVSLAVSPDLVHVYVATPDPIGTVEGVAELDMTAPDGAWTVRALDARAPTTHVAAGLVGEFVNFRTDQLANPSPPPWQAAPVESDLFTLPVPRVYAALDSRKCGRNNRVACGIAVIDPVAGGLMPDPAQPPTTASITPKQSYLAPIQVPGTVLDMVLVPPPAVPPSDVTNNILTNPPQPPMMVVAPSSGRRLTSMLLSVTSSDGRVYVVDVGHWAAPSDVSIINTYSEKSTTTRTRVVTAVNGLPYVGVNPDGTPIYQPAGTAYVALWSDSDLPLSFTNSPTDVPAGYGLQPDYLYDTSGMVLQPHVTPGYTGSDTWNVTYQGLLPGLNSRVGQVSLSTSGTNQVTGWAAMQDPTGLATGDPFRDVVRLYDPTLGVHVGDVVLVAAVEPDANNPICPAGYFEMQVTDFLYPSPAYPGGAVMLANRTCQDNFGNPVACPGDPSCLGGRGVSNVWLTIRAGAMVLTGASVGYAGRPPIVTDPTVAPLFRFEYADEDSLSCPMLDAGAPWPPLAACDAACRSQCEQLALARKARRFYYVTSSLVCDGWSGPYKQMCADTWRNLAWPITTGPVLAFRVGLNVRYLDDNGSYDNHPSYYGTTVRDATLALTTASGVSPMFRIPRVNTTATGSVMPTGLAVFDRSATTGNADDGVRVYASYPGNQVLDFTPAGTLTDITVIR
jgi:hypothetical protein